MHYVVLLVTIIALLVSGVSSSQDAQDLAQKSPQSSEKKIVVEDEKEPSAPVPKAFDPIRTLGMDFPDVEVKNIEGEIGVIFCKYPFFHENYVFKAKSMEGFKPFVVVQSP